MPVRKTKTRKAAEAIRRAKEPEITIDIDGSYTGLMEDDEPPIQDADDL